MSVKKNSKKKRLITISIITIAVVGIAVTFLMRPKTTAYENVDAKIGDITNYYSFSGNVETKNRQTVMSERVMQVSSIKVSEGDIVEVGTVLLTTSTGEEIKSKISGEVMNLTATESAQVMAGTKLLEILDYNNLEIKVKVDEYDIAALEKGKETSIKVGAINKEIKGVVSSMSKEGQIVNGVTFFTATIDLEKDDSVKIGMSAEVKVINSNATGVVTLPMKAISFDDNNNPYVLKKGDKKEGIRTEITTGINDGTTVEIKSGVSSEENILYTKVIKAATTGLGAGRNSSNGTSTTGGDK